MHSATFIKHEENILDIMLMSIVKETKSDSVILHAADRIK